MPDPEPEETKSAEPPKEDTDQLSPNPAEPVYPIKDSKEASMPTDPGSSRLELASGGSVEPGNIIPATAEDVKRSGVGSLALICVNGDEAGHAYLLNGIDMLIGRKDDAEGIYPHIDLTDQELSQPVPWVSRAHARITWTPEGCFITDIRSRNKTFVNDRELLAGDPCQLRVGDRVKIGRLEFVVQPPSS